MFVLGMIIGYGNADSIVYGDSQKPQELQMHLDKVMNELDNNNTEAVKMHLEGAQNLVASMNQGSNNDTSATTPNHTAISNNTEG